MFVKDMSRLARNYLQAGYYTEEFFPEHNIHFVAFSDGVDSEDGDDEFTQFRNIMNEWYARDISRKVKASAKLKGEAGIPLATQVPYGYIRNPEGKRFWVVDEDAAAVVRRIFKMSLDGMGVDTIASALEAEGIPTPPAYWKSKGIKRGGRNCGKADRWNNSTISNILAMQEYCGDVLNFKSYKPSFKSRKQINRPREDWLPFENVHTPIIDRATYEAVQKKREKKLRKRKPKTGERNKFCGLLRCGNCGTNLAYHKNAKSGIEYFNCQEFNRSKKVRSCDSSSYVRLDYLEDFVLRELLNLARFAASNEERFSEVVCGLSQEISELELKRKHRELSAMRTRDREIDKRFERTYEDNVSGKLTDERYAKLTESYEQEQADLSAKITALEKELAESKSKVGNAASFIKAVQQYSRSRKLSTRMLTELIDYIEVFQREKVDGVYRQRIRIHYNCIDAITISASQSPMKHTHNSRYWFAPVYDLNLYRTPSATKKQWPYSQIL